MLVSSVLLFGCSDTSASTVARQAPPADPSPLAALAVPELVGARFRADVPVTLVPGASCGTPSESVMFFSSDAPVLRWDGASGPAGDVPGAERVTWTVAGRLDGESPAAATEATLAAPDVLTPGLHSLCVEARGPAGVVGAAAIRLNVAPPIYSQLAVNEIGWDGKLTMTSAMHRVVRGHDGLIEDRWVTSDFVRTEHVWSEAGAKLPLSISHGQDDDHYSYTVRMPRSVQSGSLLVTVSRSFDDGSRVTSLEPGVFQYEMNHHPNSGQATRSLSVFRLPEGAVLVEVSEGLTSREREGRVEVVHASIVPDGGVKHTRFRYRMP